MNVNKNREDAHMRSIGICNENQMKNGINVFLYSVGCGYVLMITPETV